MKKFINKKILFIIGLFIFFIILNSKPSFAYDMETDFLLSSDYNNSWVESYLDLDMNFSDGVKALIDSHQDYFNITSNDLGRYWILMRFDYIDSTDGSSKYCYLYYCSESEIFLYYLNGGQNELYQQSLWTVPGNRYSMLFTEDGFYGSTNFLSDGTSNSDNGPQMFWFGLPVTDNTETRTVIASNHDIYTKPQATLLFQQPTLKTATTLAPVIQREKMKGTLQVVLTEIIQILPLIIVVVVSLVGLRKALKMLSMQFHRF